MKAASLVCATAVSIACLDGSAAHYVSKAGSNEYPYASWETAAHSIQDAINASADYPSLSPVTVGPGQYDENVLVPRGLHLRGAGADSSVIRAVREAEGSRGWAAVILEGGETELRGLTVDGKECWWGIICEQARVRDCVVTGAGDGISASDSFVDRCTVWRCGVGIFARGVTVIYDTVVSGCSECGVYGIGDEGYALLVHCTIAGNGWGASNLDTMLVSMRDSILWRNIEGDGGWDPVSCDIGYPSFAGSNGNISADPLFVGWGDFNDSENPIYVDCSSGPEGDGTEKNPFTTIGAALRAYDLHLSADSPCIGAASDGLNMGAFPEDIPVRERSTSVLINVAPGIYNEGGLILQDRVHLRAMDTGRAAIIPPKHNRALWTEGASSIEGFSLAANLTAAIVCAPGSTPLISRCSFRPATEVGWDYPSMRSAVIAAARDARPTVSQCVVTGFQQAVWGGALIHSSTLVNNKMAVLGPDDGEPPEIHNSIIWPPDGDGGLWLVNVPPANVAYSLVPDPSLDGVNGNMFADPLFVDPGSGDFRLLPTSPCIDVGDNEAPGLPDTDIAGMHRIMYGGKSQTVDMGAYEYYINDVRLKPPSATAALIWSSRSNVTYSVFYTDGLPTWHLAEETVPSAGDTVSFWTDDGSKTGLPPTLAPRRFYRVLENR